MATIWKSLTGPFTCTGCGTAYELCPDASTDGVQLLCWICNTARIEAIWAARGCTVSPIDGLWTVTFRLPGEARVDRYAPSVYGCEDYGVPRTSHATRQAAFAAVVLAARDALAVSVTAPDGHVVLTWDKGQDVWITWGLVADSVTRYRQLAAARWAADQLTPATTH